MKEHLENTKKETLSRTATDTTGEMKVRVLVGIAKIARVHRSRLRHPGPYKARCDSSDAVGTSQCGADDFQLCDLDEAQRRAIAEASEREQSASFGMATPARD